MGPRRPSYLLLNGATLAYARIERASRWGLGAVRRCAGGVLGGALSVEERSRLTQSLYSAAGPGSHGIELFEWERQWFDESLPAPPGRILVGGAGAGREVAALVHRGYEVDALEPTTAMAERCREQVGDGGLLVVASYEDLAGAVLDGLDHPVAALTDRRYDAVLLGWGSLTHVLDPKERKRLMRAADRLCPDGPILASFWGGDPPPLGRIDGIAHSAGAWIGRMRGVDAEPARTEHFMPTAGFGVVFTADDLEALASCVGRPVIRSSEGGFPHATFQTPGA